VYEFWNTESFLYRCSASDHLNLLIDFVVCCYGCTLLDISTNYQLIFATFEGINIVLM